MLIDLILFVVKSNEQMNHRIDVKNFEIDWRRVICTVCLLLFYFLILKFWSAPPKNDEHQPPIAM